MNISSIKQPFTSLFKGDFSYNNFPRITPKVLFCTVHPAELTNYQLLILNEKLTTKIGLGTYQSADLPFLVAQQLPNTILPYATAYAGHQFGHWAGQLGDGRALLAGEIECEGITTELQWKGAGSTPYSRSADGRAVLRSSVREYLMSEAMHHLKIPTTRALSLCLSGEKIIRDPEYNGNRIQEKGAIVLRTAESFLRFGHFELLSAQKEGEELRKLTDYCIEKYYPNIKTEGIEKYKEFFVSILKRTAKLIVEWQRVGFVHGVMNTDNMSAIGITIDYGPFSMLDEYDLKFTPNTTDLPDKRYAFGEQPKIAQWNLWQLGNALFPLINDAAFFEDQLDFFENYYWDRYDQMMMKKFGLEQLLPEDVVFLEDWQSLMHRQKLDFTLFFSQLEKWRSHKDENDWESVSYLSNNKINLEEIKKFLEIYAKRLEKNESSLQNSLALMKENNPKFTLRNYLLYDCIKELEEGNDALLRKLIDALENPYEEIYPAFSTKRPEKYNGLNGCSTLSCSS